MSDHRESDAANTTRQPDNGETGLPGLRTWPKLYGFVLGCFVLWMLLLWALERVFQ